MRSSNLELLRIITIFLIIIGHGCFNSIGSQSSWEECSVLSFFVESFSVIGVNVFILITGYFSAKLKKKSVFNLLYICFFYALLRIGYDVLFAGFSKETILSLFFVSFSNWFIPVYLGLLIIATLINPYIEQSSQANLRTILIVFFVFQIWFGWRPGFLYKDDFAGGYSILSFVFLYILGRYYRLYGIKLLNSKTKCFLIYFSISILLALWVTCCFYYDWREILKQSRWHAYNNPLIIISSLAFFALFTQINIRPNKIINYLAQSTLGVLLFHANRPIWPYMQDYFKNLYMNENQLYILFIGGGYGTLDLYRRNFG